LNPEQSVGAKCEKQFGGLNCYEATGRACEAFLEIAPLIKDLLDRHKEDLEKGEQRPRAIAFAIFMLGTEPAGTQPTIVFASLSERQRKRAKSLVKEKNLLAKHPGIKMKTIEELPALPRGDQHTFETSKSSSSRSPHHGSTAEQENNKGKHLGVLTLDGGGIRGYSTLLMLQAIMDHIRRLETLSQYEQPEETLPAAGYRDGGGFVNIRDETYCLSALHPYLDIEAEEEEHDGHQSHDFDFDPDSDDECEHDEIQNPASKKSSSESRPGMARKITPSIDTTGKPVVTAKAPRARLDYRVVRVHEADRNRRNTITPHRESPRSITPRVVASVAEEANVIINTQTTGPVKGQMMRTPRYIKMAGWPTFQEMWVVKMSRDAIPGDCGAWVVEDSDGSQSKLFGHVIAGQPGSFEAYILPACHIFDDIEKRFGARPTLPVSTDSPVAGCSSRLQPHQTTQRTAYLPAHYFNYMVGTSTGGLIAIMLGRLQMNVDDALKEYENLGREVFGKPRLLSMRGPIPWLREKYSDNKIEQLVKGIIRRRLKLDPGSDILSEDPGFFSPRDLCQTIVCAGGENLTTGIEQPFLFRTYSSKFSVRSMRSGKRSLSSMLDSKVSHGSDTCSNSDSDDSSTSSNSPCNIDEFKIWEVARATAAAPTYFKPYVKHRDINGYKFVDSSHLNNPTMLAFNEVYSMSSRRGSSELT